MKLTHDFIQEFPSHSDSPGHCRIRCFSESGHKSVVICSALPGVGPSVMNFAERIASLVWPKIGQPDSLTWIEHWSLEALPGGRPYEYGHVSLERIDGTFQVTAPDHAVAMSKQDVEALIGQAL